MGSRCLQVRNVPFRVLDRCKQQDVSHQKFWRDSEVFHKATVEEGEERVRRRLMDWQAPWLMVIDKYDDEEVFERFDLREFRYQCPNGKFLITTRHWPGSIGNLVQPTSVIEVYPVENAQSMDIIRTWERNALHWSGDDKRFDAEYATLDPIFQSQLKKTRRLGRGKHGVVCEIIYRSVPLARKSLDKEIAEERLKLLKEELAISQKLEGHRHTIKIIGTYWKRDDFNIITFPVGVCDLGLFLEDYEKFWCAAECPEAAEGPKERAEALGFGMASMYIEARTRLQEIMGCVTQGMAWMHSHDIFHRDLKPPNILLRSGEVYLTDFGISDDRSHADSASTDFAAGYTWGYAAPEIVSESRNNPEKGDVYALGCVLLHILTAIHGVNTEQKTDGYCYGQHHRREMQFREHQLKTGDCYHPTISQNLIKFLLPMFDDDRDQRPTIKEVDESLRQLGGAASIYHGPCCRNENSVLRNSEVHQPSGTASDLP